MGIVNASPESFSDGGRTGDLEAQVGSAPSRSPPARTLIDVGGESGVTDGRRSAPRRSSSACCRSWSAWRRDGVLVSVDTWKPPVATRRSRAGAAMINDVSGLLDPGSRMPAPRRGGALVVMHTRARPKEKTFPHYDDLARRRARLPARADRARARARRRRGSDRASTPAPTSPRPPRRPWRCCAGSTRWRSSGGRSCWRRRARTSSARSPAGRPRERLAGTLAAVAEGVDRGRRDPARARRGGGARLPDRPGGAARGS